MMKKMIMLLLLGLSFGASACTAPGEAGNDSVSDTAVTASTIREDQPSRLNEDYQDALPVMTQLAAGTLQLEETDLAVNEAMAAEILPLWQAAQSLSNSDTAASVEVNSVLNQIQDAMLPAQIAAIAGMTLTNESMTALLESGAITFGRGFGRGQTQDNVDGFTPPDGFVPGAGGGPGGSGGPGGGGEFGGPGGGNLSEDDIATRQAQFASGDGLGEIQDQAIVGAVIRLLQTKTGDAPEGLQGGIAEAVFTAVSNTINLPVEEIQAQLTEETTLVSIIEANGGDVTAVREAILIVLNALPNASDLDVEQITDSWLSE